VSGQHAAVKADVPIRKMVGSNTGKYYHSVKRVPVGYNSKAILEFGLG
jgi:hypothetical protein